MKNFGLGWLKNDKMTPIHSFLCILFTVHLYRMEDSENIIMVKIGCRDVYEKDVLPEERMTLK